MAVPYTILVFIGAGLGIKMTLESYSWNVVIAGYWNRAILNPDGISTRLFGNAPGTPIEVEVPLDAINPYRVTIQDVTVVAMSNRLTLEPRTSSYEQLNRA